MRDNFPDPRVVVARIDAICRFDRRRELAEIKVPTLIVGAEDDMVTPAYFSRDLAKAIRGARLAMLPYGGHSCYQTRVAEWNRIVLDFLRSVPPR